MSERVCPVCLEATEDMIVLFCTHVIHEDCARGLIDKRCPVCRGDAIWPDSIKKDIEENIYRRKEELINEETHLLRREYIEIGSIISSFDEFALAISYLEDHGVPEHFIPENLAINSQFRPDIGVIFADVVTRAMLRMAVETESSDEESSDEESSDEESSDKH